MAVNGQKLLPQGNRGGALAVSRPKVSLVKKGVKKDITSAPDTMLVIKTRVVEIEKILKGSVALDKKLQDQERKQKEKSLRAEEENELEAKEDKDDKKVKKKKSKIKLGFLDGLIKFINDVLMGWLIVRMIDWLPQLKKILPILGGALDFLTSTVLGIVNVLGTFLMWGDKVITGSRNFIKNIFGEKGVAVFDGIIDTIGNLFNVIAILGMTAAAFGGESGKQKNKKVDRRTKGNKKLKERYKRRQKFKQQKAKIKKQKIAKRVIPKSVRKSIQKAKIGAKRFTKNLGKTGKVVGRNIGKNLLRSGKNIVRTGSKVASTARKGLTTAAKTASKFGKSGIKTATKVGKSGLKTATKFGKTGLKTATKLGKTGLKTATKLGKTGLTTATKLGKTGLKAGLKGLKSLKKVVSPILKRIPFIGALLDFALNYFVFKEPLGRAAFMAIGAGVAAWLGGIIGSIIPVGGTLVGAALGGWAGDKLAGLLYDAIFKGKDTPKPKKEEVKKTSKQSNVFKFGKNTYDLSKPMGGLSEEEFAALEGRERRMLLKRLQSYSNQNYEERYANIKSNTTSVSENTDAISKSASYEEGGEGGTVVIVENSSGGGEKQQTESESTLVVAGGGDDGSTDALYKGG